MHLATAAEYLDALILLLLQKSLIVLEIDVTLGIDPSDAELQEGLLLWQALLLVKVAIGILGQATVTVVGVC